MRASKAVAPEGLSKAGGAGGTTATTPPLKEPSPLTAPPSRTHTSRPDRARARAWAELLRLPALFTVPGDALAGAAAVSARPTPRTLLAIASSLCLYEAGMALNDWADRDVDAVERPHRPLPSGRIRPAAALGAACALTGAGLSLAACAGRPALTVAVPLAATVWAYDLALKNTPAGPFAMATARGLDLLLGAAATAGAGVVGTGPSGSRAGMDGVGRKLGACRAWATAVADEPRAALGAATVPGAVDGTHRALTSTALLGIRQALPSAALLGAHTLALTTVSRREAQGGSPLAPFAALAVTAALTRTVTRQRSLPTDRIAGSRRGTGSRRQANLANLAAAAMSRLSHPPRQTGDHMAPPGPSPEPLDTHAALRLALAGAYAATTARPYLHATLNPSPPLTQRAVTAGIRATIPLQAALTARSGAKGATVTALLTTALAPLAGRFARKVSVT
ncbi:UbiA family prenyltransferase [Streptomyces canus]|uniref:SCO3242 family prenyltransferase n=1 Tax=Streptomyces canus TaxID=58343 RepID=UPI0022560EC9|nr:UbiA family prenyltransferase [Streptomyces canus]MCX5253238.1 UbiA family prenyltransferase [Streptomyces canus]